MTGTLPEGSLRYDRTSLSPAQAAVVALAGGPGRVLELGASTGYVTDALVAHGHEVTPLEFDRDALQVLAARHPRAAWCDLEDVATLAPHSATSWEVVVVADVLEHLREPAAVLAWARDHLAAQGRLVVSLPNIAYWRVRRQLLGGRFTMTDVGILDRTHLRFFTLDTAEALFAAEGFVVRERRPVLTDYPFGGAAGEFGRGIGARLPGAAQVATRVRDRLLRSRPGLVAYQCVWHLEPR